MSRDLQDVLARGVPAELSTPDFAALARRGVRRRRVKLAGVVTGTLAIAGVAAAIAVTAASEGSEPPIIGERGPDVVGTWSDLPESPLDPRSRSSTATDGTLVAFWGGEAAPDRNTDPVVQPLRQDGAIYDAELNAWTYVPEPPIAPRHQPFVGFARGRMVVWGGTALQPIPGGGFLGQENETLQDGAVFDLETQTWVFIPDHTTGAVHAPRVDWDGERLLVWAGTRTADDRPTLSGAEWTQATGWVPIPEPDLVPRNGSAVAVDADHLVFWGGGVDVNEETERTLDDGAIYDRRSRTWTILPPAPLSARWFSSDFVGDANAPLEDGRFRVVGGVQFEPEERHFRDGAELDVVALTWRSITPAPEAARYVETRRDGNFALTDDEGRLWLYRSGDWHPVDLPYWPQIVSLDDLALIAPEPMNAPTDGSFTVFVWSGARWASAQTGWAPRLEYTLAPLPDGLLIWGGSMVDVDENGNVHNSRPTAVGLRLQLDAG